MHLNNKLFLLPILIYCSIFSHYAIADNTPQKEKLTTNTKTGNKRFIDIYSFYKFALQNDKSLAKAKYDHLATLEDEPIARAPLYPSITLNSTALKNDSNIDTNDTAYLQGEIKLSQFIYNPKTFDALEQIEHRKKIANLAYEQQQQSLVYDLINKYIAFLRAQDQVQLEKSQLELITTQYQDVKKGLEQGIKSNSDFITVNANYKLAEANLMRAKSNLIIARNNLSIATGYQISLDRDSLKTINTTKYSKIKYIENLFVNLNQNNLVNLIRDKNLSLKIASLNNQVATSVIKYYKKDYHPSLTFILSGTKTQYENSSLEQQDVISAKLLMSWNLYSGNSTSSEIKKAEYQYNASQFQYQNLLNINISTLENAINNLEQNKELVLALQIALESQKQLLKISNQSYQMGLKKYFELQTNIKNYYDAEQKLNNAIYNLILNDVEIKRVLSQLDEKYIKWLNFKVFNSAPQL